eukprot:CAMPEP_0202972532 /NCGR_PEP_ID=MMETSP1396-20130829/37354_1 /ASSEMBLY_ACC=CAM_ASM_000872 /TAXON_ID= /ORGANISM="Pseudokeronopsis sp., Strain Brazil" /LENGTH=59 /DNA_ID=CAMNT_0049703047 /DNA_START=590 /DNA_END=769 /DNA_ORIENTATION=+
MKLGSFALEEPEEVDEEGKEDVVKEEEGDSEDDEEGVVYYDKALYAVEEGLGEEDLDFE